MSRQVWPDGVDEIADAVEGEAAQHLVPVDLAHAVELGDAAAHDVGPPAEIELEAAVGVGDFLLPAARRRGGDHAGQVRRALRGGRPLRPAHVGEAGGADLAGAPGLGGDPLDRVVAIGAVVDHGAPLALRLAAPAHVDGDVGVAVLLVEPRLPGPRTCRPCRTASSSRSLARGARLRAAGRRRPPARRRPASGCRPR